LVKLYAFLWHVNHAAMMASEGAGGYHCESAETERTTEDDAKEALKTWLAERQRLCEDEGCEHTPIVTCELRPKMVMSGMTANMVTV